MQDGDVEVLVPSDQVEEEARSLAGRFATQRTQDSRRLDTVAEYAGSNECRSVFLRRYFGEDGASPCRICDVCRGVTARAPQIIPPLQRKRRMRLPRHLARAAASGGRRRRSGSPAMGDGARAAERAPRPASDPLDGPEPSRPPIVALNASASPGQHHLDRSRPDGSQPGRSRRRRRRRRGRGAGAPSATPAPPQAE